MGNHWPVSEDRLLLMSWQQRSSCASRAVFEGALTESVPDRTEMTGATGTAQFYPDQPIDGHIYTVTSDDMTLLRLLAVVAGVHSHVYPLLQSAARGGGEVHLLST